MLGRAHAASSDGGCVGQLSARCARSLREVADLGAAPVGGGGMSSSEMTSEMTTQGTPGTGEAPAAACRPRGTLEETEFAARNRCVKSPTTTRQPDEGHRPASGQDADAGRLGRRGSCGGVMAARSLERSGARSLREVADLGAAPVGGGGMSSSEMTTQGTPGTGEAPLRLRRYWSDTRRRWGSALR